MIAPILIAYTTRSGSTAEVAEAVGIALRAEGLTADVVPMRSVESLQGRTAIILGAPLYIGRLPKEFHQFVNSQRAALELHCPRVFMLGPTRNFPADFEMAQAQASRQLQRHPWLHPAEVKIFGGRFDIMHMPPPFHLISRLPIPAIQKVPVADIRDWAAIRAWANAVARRIKSAA